MKFLIFVFMILSVSQANNLVALLKSSSISPDEKKIYMCECNDAKHNHNKKNKKSIINTSFGLYPYNHNYFLPLSTVDKSQISGNEKNLESEMQFSIAKPLSYNLLGLDDSLIFAYTHHAWWQLYAKSSPFREINYMPQIFHAFPTNFKSLPSLDYLIYGFIHESNGEAGVISRSWNRAYIEAIFLSGNLETSIQVWARVPLFKNDAKDDFEHYYGNGRLKFTYTYGNNELTALIRNNLSFSDNKGAYELNWSYPFFEVKDTFFYAKAFSGYGQSLIDFNVHSNNLGLGLSFSR